MQPSFYSPGQQPHLVRTNVGSRTTRRCDEIGKDVFRIFDAVNLYSAIAPVSEMKPVVVNPNISFTQLVNELAQVQDPTAVNEIVDQLLAKLQRKKRHLSDVNQAAITAIAGMSIDNLVAQIRRDSSIQTAEWFRQRAGIAEILDRRDGGTRPILVSYHPDELRRVE